MARKEWYTERKSEWERAAFSEYARDKRTRQQEKLNRPIQTLHTTTESDRESVYVCDIYVNVRFWVDEHSDNHQRQEAKALAATAT